MDEKKQEQQPLAQEELENAAQKLLPAAEAGEVAAQYELGRFYYQCDQYEQSLHWWGQAAEHGVNPAWVRLGVQYAFGLGTEKDEDRALECIQKAMENDPGDTSALCYLGMFYEQGIGVEANLEQAVRCYRQAAEMGNPAAQFDLAMCYFYGKGVAEDTATALKWVEQSAKQGNPEAQFFLGLQYYLGEKVERNLNTSIRYLRSVAEENEEAQQLLQIVEGEAGMEKQISDINALQTMIDQFEAYMAAEGIEWDDEEED